MQQPGSFKIPGAVWWVMIPILIGAIMPVIAQFYPTDQFFWSALVVAIGGAIVAAIQAYRQATATPVTPVSGPQAANTPADGDNYTWMASKPKPEKGFTARWLLG